MGAMLSCKAPEMSSVENASSPPRCNVSHDRCFGACRGGRRVERLRARGAGGSPCCDHGGVCIGRSIHAGQVSLADGTDLAAQKLERVLTNDPAMGIIRHVDAGYEIAEQTAAEQHVRIPPQEQ